MPMMCDENVKKENLSAIMPEKRTNSKIMSSSKCSCCPYGFHIDRDFVRFCDTLYNTTQLDKLRQQRRERRKENKSVESYLGIGNLVTSFDTKKKNEVNFSVLNKNSTLPNDFYLHSDGLKNAVIDFEDTWQKSLKKSSSSNDIPKKQNGYHSIHKKTSLPFTGHIPNNEKRDNLFNSVSSKSCSSSTSSVSSQSTTVSNSNCLVSTDVLNPELSSLDIFTTTSISKSNMSFGTSVQKSVLTNIRHQMASSLQRLKELEEQVKCIPILEVKLSALKEEKKSLLNQLKFNHKTSHKGKEPETHMHLKDQLKRLENQGIMSPTLSRKCLSTLPNENRLSSPGMASCLDAVISKKGFLEKEIVSKLNYCNQNNNLSKQSISVKSVGTSCSVLTRDIGIGYVPNKLKSIAVGCDNLTDQYTSKKSKMYEPYVSSESLESDLESFKGSDEQIKSRMPLKSTFSENSPNKVDVFKKYIDSFTSMDIKYFDKSVNTELMNDTIKRVITASKFVQTSKLKLFRNSSSQTIADSKLIKSSKYFCDKAVGNTDINDINCLQCKSSKDAQGLNGKISSCDKCQTISPIVPLSSRVLTKTVAVGDFDINYVCNECQHFKSESFLNKTPMQSVGVNTSNDLVISSNSTNSDIHICDKCSATIHSVARGLAANINPLSNPNNNESKIPRSSVKTTSVGKTNNMKLPKLKIPIFQNQKNIETIDDNHLNSETTSDAKNIDSDIRFHSENQNVILKNDYETSDELKERDSESKTSEILPTLANLPVSPRKKFEISKEIKGACKVLSDCLQKSDKKCEKKALSSLSIIQTEWFRIANLKNADPLLIEDYLDMFEDFSRLLLERVVNLSDSNGNTALHYAVSYGNFDVVSILIDSKVCDVNKKNKAGYTSIMLVALANMKNDTHQYVVQRLFSIGDINIKATQNGQTALMLAVSHGKKEIAKILIDAGAEVNLQDKDGSTALMCAAEHGHLDIVKLLLSNPDCDPSIVDNDDCNALTVAMEAGHKDIGLLLYTNMNFSRGNSPYSTLKCRKRSTPRSTPPPRTPTLRTPPLPSPSARSTNSIPSSFHFSS